MSDSFNPNIFVFIDKINDSVSADPQREFSFQVPEKCFASEGS